MKTIGIIGGMGPEATLDLFYKIIKNTPAKKDQEHIHLIIDNYPQIPDRTQFILGKGDNPLPYLLKSAKLLENAGADAICMPCNTAHFFVEDIRKNINVPFISIVESVLKDIKENYTNVERIGLLASEGTIAGKVYHRIFEKEGYTIVVPEKNIQKKIMDVIYSVKAGKIKEKVKLMQECIDKISNKADILVAACTEIPILIPHIESKIPVIDATISLAKSVVEFVLSD
ncbi:MAG TPA: amino acid racemase [Candidatus Aerophobetes bacterium]|uniref:Amino acid racemase n=1 Tax=Aerophobetes bacterium TaxID=2030807 RepID=A0A7V5I016_UNCAE|nr:amino acid racemase [Candidatus Aerophobetes bacterium]